MYCDKHVEEELNGLEKIGYIQNLDYYRWTGSVVCIKAIKREKKFY